MAIALLRLDEVSNLVGASRSSIYRWVKEARFPRPVKLGERAIAWPSDEVESFIESRRAERDAKAAEVGRG